MASERALFFITCDEGNAILTPGQSLMGRGGGGGVDGRGGDYTTTSQRASIFLNDRLSHTHTHTQKIHGG